MALYGIVNCLATVHYGSYIRGEMGQTMRRVFNSLLLAFCFLGNLSSADFFFKINFFEKFFQ